MKPACPQGPARFRRIVRPWVLLLFAFVVASAAWLSGIFDRGPRYQDMSASEWLGGIWDGTVSYEEGTVVFNAMGPDGALFLASKLTDTQFLDAKRWSDFTRRHSWPFWTQTLVRPPPDDGGVTQRQVAAELLLGLRSNAAPAFNIVWNVFQRDDDDLENEAAITAILQSLPSKLEHFVPQLAYDVSETNRYNRVDCISLLASLGTNAKVVIPVLTNAVAESGNVGRSAALALWKIDRETNVIVGWFSNNLEHGSNRDKIDTLRAFKAVPDVARLAAPAIEHALGAHNLNVEMEAVQRLMEIDPDRWKATARANYADSHRVIQVLLKKVRNGSDTDQVVAIEKIALFGPKAEEAVSTLVDILRAWEPPPRSQIRSIFTSKKDAVAMAAVDTLAEIGPSANPATQILLDLLRHDYDRQYIHHYCRALGQIGPTAVLAVPTLRAMLITNLPSVRSGSRGWRWRNDVIRSGLANAEVANALCLIDSQSTNAVSILKDCYAAADEPNCYSSISHWKCRAGLTLWKLGLATNPPSPQLIMPEIEFNSEGIEMLGDMGSLARSALPDLEKRFQNWQQQPLQPCMALALAIRKIDPNEADCLSLPGILLLSEHPQN